MTYTASYASPLGKVLLSSDGSALTGLWFAGQKYFAAGLADDACGQSDLPIFDAARAWLDAYFAGEEPGPLLPVAFAGTPFQHMVWEELLRIPYGETCTYGDLAQRIGERRGAPTSARAVGAAVGRNPVSVIVPCHRVLGASGALTGYAGGVWRKRALLALEQRGISIVEAAERPGTLIQQLTEVWERSVRATHAFLSEDDIVRLRGMVPRAFAEVPHLLVARRAGCVIGFAGTDGAFLEMLFVDAEARGMGAGRLLFERVTELYGVTELSVNEQNPQAVDFYEHMGFSAYRRTETDTQGDPFPLLYMNRLPLFQAWPTFSPRA